VVNPLPERLHIGTLGELLVQIRLLQYDVQAVATHKDTGNDLLATRGEVFRALQVKTTRTQGKHFTFSYKETMTKAFNILALVRLNVGDTGVLLDKSSVYLLRRTEVEERGNGCFKVADLEESFLLNAERVARLFSNW
jgi:hypothetical protein